MPAGAPASATAPLARRSPPPDGVQCAASQPCQPASGSGAAASKTAVPYPFPPPPPPALAKLPTAGFLAGCLASEADLVVAAQVVSAAAAAAKATPHRHHQQ